METSREDKTTKYENTLRVVEHRFTIINLIQEQFILD